MLDNDISCTEINYYDLSRSVMCVLSKILNENLNNTINLNHSFILVSVYVHKAIDVHS